MATTSGRRSEMNAIVRLTMVLLGCFHLICCAHKTLIRSEPPGATIQVDGQEVGDSPVWIERPYGSFDPLEIQASLKSFEPTTVRVSPDTWFLWPALLATTPFWFVPAVGIPTVGPLLCGVWALATSPTLCSLALLRKYPEDVVLRMRPKISSLDGTVQPTDAWTVPKHYLPNPLPPPPDSLQDPAEETQSEMPQTGLSPIHSPPDGALPH